MNVGQFSALVERFAHNWSTNAPEFAITIIDQELDVEESHPLYGALASLCSGHSASLPFFAGDKEVVWCTLAPDSDSLREAVAALHAWVLPSFGGERTGDGYVQPATATGELASAIISVSPGGYYRWRCPRHVLNLVCEKLRIRYRLEAVRPVRTRPPRPSLYELRARFSTALLVGDRNSAEEIIQLLDSLQVETAVNTQFMRIRLWHHFREHERIRSHPDLPHLLAQPLPPKVRAWIDEARGDLNAPTARPEVVVSLVPELVPPAEIEASPVTWTEWFACVKKGKNRSGADLFLQERAGDTLPDLSLFTTDSLIASFDELSVDDVLRTRERNLILQGVAELLEEYVREPEFPRPSLGSFYLALLRLWSALHAGISTGREHGHVLLELASAVLQLNLEPNEVCMALEKWWKAKPSPSQLPFALDAIELLERELPDPAPVVNLWIEVADVIKRGPNLLPPGDREMWRMVGKRLEFDDAVIAEYLPPDPESDEAHDILKAGNLKRIAIVCLREQQAEQAASVIRARSGAEAIVVTATAAGAETTQACTADVVLFVWMASTHAVFRAFDGFDRKRFCYVQGTGASSITRALERWVTHGQIANS